MYEKDRQELANAEKLFDLPITMYPELLQVQKEMTGLDKIYEIYKQQKVRRLSETSPILTNAIFIRLSSLLTHELLNFVQTSQNSFEEVSHRSGVFALLLTLLPEVPLSLRRVLLYRNRILFSIGFASSPNPCQ